MSTKLNCWEFNNCGREPNGLMVGLRGECPVASAMKHDGVHGGRAGGRFCWVVRNSSEGRIDLSDDTCASCHTCTFYRRVIFEEKEGAQCLLATASV